MANLATPYYEDGSDLTGFCTAAVVGKTFLKISAARQAGGPNLVSGAITDTVAGGNISVAPAGAGDKVVGVAKYDQVINALVGILRATKVVPVTAGAAITAGQEVQSDAAGKAIPLAAGKAAGLALDSAANGADCAVSLYL